MLRTFCILLCAALLASFTVACGDDSDSGGGSSAQVEQPTVSEDLGVEETTTLSSLDEEQRGNLCVQLEAYAQSQFTEQELKEAGCSAAGVFAAAFSGGGAEVCRQTYDECLAAPAEDVPASENGEEQEESACDPDKLQECDATVEEMEACMYEQVYASKQALSLLNCNAISGNIELGDGDQDAEEMLGPKCAALKEKCPDAIPQSDAGSPSLGGSDF